MFLRCEPNPHQNGRLTRAMIYEAAPGTCFAIDAEALHRQPELLNGFRRGLDRLIRALDATAYLLLVLGVLAAMLIGWWIAGLGLVACVLMLAANRRLAGRIAQRAAERSSQAFLKLYDIGCVWLLKD